MRDNGYETVTSDDAYAFIRHGSVLPEKSVMLTFDDGRKSVWAVAYPLLKKYGFKGTVFLSSGIMRDDNSLSVNLDTDSEKEQDSRLLYDCDSGPMPMISWKEAEVMHRSGIIDFQAHCWDHRKIPVSSRIANFVNPSLIDSFFYTFSVPIMRDLDLEVSGHGDVLGAPVYSSGSQFSDRQMYLEDVSLRKKCIEWMKDHGDADGFVSRDWKRRLFAVVREHKAQHPFPEDFESKEAQMERMAANLTRTKNNIENHLDDKQVRHFAYPWGRGSEVAIEASKRAGFASNYWSMIPGRSSNRPGDDPFRMVRLKHDFIERLPGEGRVSLKDIFMYKVVRRASGNIDY